ncbi:hypothetical protein A1O3_00260 [Capronia epimyces CBS 606.96]|uniref:Oxidoreductase n=1 Tax=Capronia epimyces CBS 606.96 TaxID=1182542 RepID=W9YPW3_9EURO|nr:uncharacterized protein A1O3_00260 [Capronia epimyces CBS 606.96]EXJ91710.1 hypothetical protein A1O3_00260 [Capronia epimyces CBS 606.96]
MGAATATATPGRVWVITGCSSGLGKELALAVLKHNDRVIATSRNIGRLEELRKAGAATLQLDPNTDLALLRQFADEAINVYGKVDVLVNNAAYVAYGTIEETSPEYTLQQYQTNVFSVLNMSRAFLPHFRSRGTGVIASLGSIGSRLKSPNMGLYLGTKAALRSMHLALDLEVRPLGIQTCLIQPGRFRTPLLSSDGDTTNVRHADSDAALISAYDKLRSASIESSKAVHGRQLGDPALGAQRIYEVLTLSGMAQAKGEIPPELLLGTDAYEATKTILEQEIKVAEQWREVSCSTDFQDGLGVL